MGLEASREQDQFGNRQKEGRLRGKEVADAETETERDRGRDSGTETQKKRYRKQRNRKQERPILWDTQKSRD